MGDDLPKGDCYEAAFKACCELNTIKPHRDELKSKDIHIVHGYVTPPEGPYKGRRIKHAWIQCGDHVFETSNGQRAAFSTAEFSSKFSPDERARYTLEQAMAEIERTGGYGFWSEV